MDQLTHESVGQSPNKFAPTSIPRLSESGSGKEKENTTSRKNQKADREKLRRDRLNEQFLELGKVLDPDRPKNDKGSILADTIQVVTDLTTQINVLKAEFTTLTEESRELTQEKNDLREEKASLKSDIENLNSQYQNKIKTTYPYNDYSMIMHPPPYPMHVPMPMPMPMSPMQPYPFFGPQNCSNFVQYFNHNPIIEQQSVQQGARTRFPNKKSAKEKLYNCEGESNRERSEGSNDVMTELELKTPGSGKDDVSLDSSSSHRKSRKITRKGNEFTIGSSSSKCCSSSNCEHDSSSSSVVGGGKALD